MGSFADYDRFDALGLADLVKKKEVTPVELVEEAIDRVEKLNPQLNAVIHKIYDLAREKAKEEMPSGPFAGVPFFLKDLIAACAGVPLRKGSRFYKDYVPDRDCEMVKRFKKAGVIILGKTNTPEFGLTVVTEPELFGPSKNPWDLSRTTGGSSGGSASAVAAHMVPMAHGNDGGGSIRIPASCCGIFGLKPSRGRNPTGPDAELWNGLACDHVLTRSVRDSAAMLDATSGPDVGVPSFAPPPQQPFLSEVSKDPGKLSIAFTSKPFLGSSVHVDCKRALQETVTLLEDLGHEVTEAAPDIDGPAFSRAFLQMLCGETGADIAEAERLVKRKASLKGFEVSTWVLGLMGRKISAVDFSKSLRLLKETSRKTGAFFQDYDVLLTPTLARPPVQHGELHARELMPKSKYFIMRLLAGLNAGGLLKGALDEVAASLFDFFPYTPIFNATGQPAMSVPLCWNEQGLPIGMHFVGRYADEGTLFRLAGQLERAKPWFDRSPPILSQS